MGHYMPNIFSIYIYYIDAKNVWHVMSHYIF